MTVEFYRQAGVVYQKLTEMRTTWQKANTHLEHGVIAEFESKLDRNKQAKAEEFHLAYEGYVQLQEKMGEFEQAIKELQAVDHKCEKVPEYEAALAKVLAEGRPLPRLSRTGVRFADAAGLPTDRLKPIQGTSDILRAWQADLAVLSKTFDEVVVGLRDALPLAEKGEFAAVMLSGRNAFGDKNPQFTDMFSAYERMYTQTVLATINTTMQVYPKGYEWLTPETGGQK